MLGAGDHGHVRSVVRGVRRDVPDVRFSCDLGANHRRRRERAMTIAYVASPFTTNDDEEAERFLVAARRMSLAVVNAGGYPVSPVMLSHADRLLLERAQSEGFWYEKTLDLLRRCDGVLAWSNDGRSRGVVAEIKGER